MASKNAKNGKGSRENKKVSKDAGGSITDTATEFLGEVEKSGEALVADVKQLFDGLTEKVTEVASIAAETTVSVADKVTKEPAELLRGLVNDVAEASETSLQAIGEHFDELRKQLLGSDDAKTAKSQKNKENKKNVEKAEKSVAEEEVVTKDVAPKKAVKKTAAKKRAATKKKSTVAKDAPAAKKVTARKKTTAVKKKAGAKKVAARKKGPVKPITLDD